jgi:quercetin dioxygenase-like cupin family protein
MLNKTLFTLAVLASLAGCQSPSSGLATIESTVLLKSTSAWNGTPYTAYPAGQPELTMLRLRIPADTTLKWHTHPIPNAAYIVSGQLHVETHDGASSIQLKQGDTLPELVNILHRGKTGKHPVELIVFYAGTPGVALTE